MEHLGSWYSTVAPDNDYRYNGKELNEDYGIGLHDYGARWYDAAIGRWNAVDPVAELAMDLTPYRYSFNDPINFFDPNGLFESRAAARNYRRKNGSWWNGDRIKKQKDGSFAIENKQTGAITFEFTDSDGDKSIITGGTVVDRLLRISEVGVDAALEIEQRNPNAIFQNSLKEQAYILGHRLGFAMPSAKVISAASSGLKAAAATTNQVANNIDEAVRISSQLIIPRAPIGGIVINGKYYKGGQFLPGPRTRLYFGRGSVPDHGLIHGTSTYPLPATGYPQLSTSMKWAVGGGGAALAFKYGWNSNVSSKTSK
jgi:RHS repeat-associated protein